MGRWVRRHFVSLLGSDCFIDCAGLLVRVIAQGDVVGVIVVVNIGHRQTPLILFGGIERDPVRCLRHVLADDP